MADLTDGEVGDILKELRTLKGVSQEQLALQLSKGQSDIAKIESGNKRISLLDFLRWCRVLGYTIDETNSVILDSFSTIWDNKSLWNNE